MRLKKGFTLIELLVVISIIALLLAILMPALGAVKERARSVVCRANLHQWGLCYQLYSSDWDQLPTFVGGTVGQTTYMESLRDYYDDINKMRTCSSATKVAEKGWTAWDGSNNIPGQADKAWYVDGAQATWVAADDWGVGSFGENSWIRETVTNRPEPWGSLTAMTRPSEVPLILDARWNNAWPTDDRLAEVGSETSLFNIGNWSSMSCFAMRRHADGVNAAMADMSAIPVDAEELWTLKWHRNFKKTNDVDMPWLDW
ncbi:MAG: type II secretion system protein [Anaerohalosphaera sp.]|nr:type II secretion system protein [Anaerohalosphaera sp.]